MLALLVLSIFVSYVNNSQNNILNYIKCFIIIASILPVSLRINLDISKMYFSYLIQNDKDIYGAEVKNPLIVEELGRIDYLITDKTGTLTTKAMKLQKICTEFAIFKVNDPNNDLGAYLNENCD